MPEKHQDEGRSDAAKRIGATDKVIEIIARESMGVNVEEFDNEGSSDDKQSE